MKAKKARRPNSQRAFLMAGVMGLEPTAFAVTGRRCNQLNYTPAERCVLKVSKGIGFVKQVLLKTEPTFLQHQCV